MKARLKAIRREAENDEEQDILKRCLILIESESKVGKAVKEAQADLDRAVLARYAVLTEAEIRTLVVEDKWRASIRTAIDGELQRLTQRLAGRVQELEERYARPLPALEHEVEAFSARVEGHLIRRMGVSAMSKHVRFRPARRVVPASPPRNTALVCTCGRPVLW